MFGHHTQKNTVPRATLYVVVYGSAYVKIAILILLACLFIQSANQAFAVEDTASSSVAEVAPVVEDVAKTSEVVAAGEVSEAAEEGSVVETEGVTEGAEDGEEVTEEIEAVVDATSSETVAEEILDERVASEDSVTATATEEIVAEEVNTTSTSSTQPVSVTPTEPKATSSDTTDSFDETESEVAGVATSTVPSNTGSGASPSTSDAVEDISTTTATEEATSSEETSPETPPVDVPDPVSDSVPEPEVIAAYEDTDKENASTTLNEVPAPQIYSQEGFLDNSNRMQFSTDECVSVGDGSYYCSAQTTTDVDSAKTVYAARDSEGDYEIFFNTGTEQKQITDNQYEDASPEYDALQNTIVWHRLIAGRYQIVEYNLDDETERLLTDTNVNNMEPASEAGIVVWQRWVDTNWELVLRDGEEELQITRNGVHDIAPDIQDGYVIWHTFDENAEQRIGIYEVATGLTSFITDTEGGEVVNPRFVLVYDTKYDNGDVVTKGFDPETGEVVPLAAQSGGKPPELPTPEPTGETRALIQNKSSNARDGSVKELLGDTDVSTTTPTPTSTGTSSQSIATSSETVLDAPPPLEVVATSSPSEPIIDMTTPTTTENLSLTEYDLIVEPFVASSSAQEGGSGSTTPQVE